MNIFLTENENLRWNYVGSLFKTISSTSLKFISIIHIKYKLKTDLWRIYSLSLVM